MEAAEQGDRWLHILKDLLSFLTQGSSLGISVDQSGQEGKEHRNKIKQAGISSDTYLPNYNPPQITCKNRCNKNSNQIYATKPCSLFGYKRILFHAVHTGSLRARNVLIVSSDQFFSSERNHSEFIL